MSKRSNYSEDDISEVTDPANSKRVRFTSDSSVVNQEAEGEFEFDHEDFLESAKKRRGAVKVEGYGSDETDTSDDDGAARFSRRAGGGGIKEKTNEDLDDMFADESTSSKSSKQKVNFDFDEKKIRYLELDEIVGQDYSSKDTFDDDSGEPIIEAFNMKSELEEGKFDEAGNYIRNKKDPDAFHDNWLQGVSRKDIENARIAHEKKEKERKLKEAQEDSSGPIDRISIWKELLTIMKPGETLLDTFQRLGSGGSSSKSKNKRNSRRYTKKAKGKAVDVSESPQPEEPKVLSPEEIQEQQRKMRIERLTDLSDKMMALGHFNVYDDSWEQILRNLKKEGAVSEDWDPSKTN